MAYYSGSATSSKEDNTSCKSSAAIKFRPSGSKLLKTRLAISHGVSALTSFFSKENSTTIQ